MNKLYLYETTKKVGNKEIIALFGVKTHKGRIILDHFAHLLEWLAVAFLFWINAQYINSWIFQVFIFICGFVCMQSIGLKQKLTTKEEFFKKIEQILEEV